MAALPPIHLTLALGLVAVLAGADPAAHDPHFETKGLWPEDVQKTAYAKETWTPAPLYVWMVKGDPKARGGQETDLKDPAHWTVDGKPASASPGEGDDVLFPAGSVIRLKEETSLSMRHLTLGKGVRLVKAVGVKPQGNLWIMEGASSEGGFIQFAGGKNVFLRNDNRDFKSAQAGIANKVIFNKPKASIEIVGTVKTWDEMGFVAGTTIVGPDARLVPGNRSIQPIFPEARLVLLSGSSFHKRGNQGFNTDLVVNGELLAGTPERPLTRDCTLGLSFKAKGKVKLEGSAKPGGPDDYGMVVNAKGRLAVHSSDPQKARLVITWNGLGSQSAKSSSEPDPVARHIDLVLQGEVNLAGVLFDRIQAGGIHLANQAIREQGVIAFGEHNQGHPDALFVLLTQPIEAKAILSIGSPDFPTPGGGKGR